MMGPKSVPKPGSAAVQEAVDLMTFLGGDNKAGAKLLNEMKCVQISNEKLLAEVKDAINASSRAQAKLDKSQHKLESDTREARTGIAIAKQTLTQQSSDLDAKKKAFDLVTKARIMEHERKSDELSAREAVVIKRESANEAFERRLNTRAEEADKRDAANDALLDDLNERDQRLRKAMGG